MGPAQIVNMPAILAEFGQMNDSERIDCELNNKCTCTQTVDRCALGTHDKHTVYICDVLY